MMVRGSSGSYLAPGILNLADRLQAARALARSELLAARTNAGHWEGELSSSALSTATAVCALAVVERESTIRNPQSAIRIANGLDWLAAHRNADGGWGDTIFSSSNISTTALVWAAFGAVLGADEKYRAVVSGAENWLTQRAGGIAPDRLAPAIIQRYGKDRTFSVPILTMCALAGRLGAGAEAWRWVLPLPFELAACPHRWFAALRLPVVSYALPALIAIGQARHHHRASRNPLARLARNLSRERTLTVLTGIQPSSGGFLEATPLTSFVTMSLAGSGQVGHPVTKKAVEFLLASARADGSWAIDTNLATWVTTLAINALHATPGEERDSRDETSALSAGDRRGIRDWLLDQQYRVEHPYTHAAPGGWAWTDLPGGVPDADDTAGALLALKNLGDIDDRVREAATAGITWLLGLQNNDGGIPTFCRGWGHLPFDRSSPDLTAHALRAWNAWRGDFPDPLCRRVGRATNNAIRYLANSQRHDGAWIPLWFGNQHAPDETNATYGTAKVVTALCALDNRAVPAVSAMLRRGTDWLLTAQNDSGGWSGFPGGPASIEETALTLEALASLLELRALPPGASEGRLQAAVAKGASWLIDQVETGVWKSPSPIGFYFAKLWYFERLYPMIFTVEALGRVAKALEGPSRAAA
ncbi:MAG: prenyltransferase/squalene oxidase repeat-containing protein [Limisphaerales bacterium]